MSKQFTVTVGDRDWHIARFKGLKGVLAMDLMSRVMTELPQIQDRLDDYIQEYRKNHTVRISPAMGKLPKFAVLGLQSEDFEAGGGTVEFPDDPSGQQILVAMVPDMLTLARRELLRFLALIAIPNSELEEADDHDRVDEALDDLGKKLLRQGDIDELLELGVVGWEVMQDQIEKKKDKLGKLMQLPFLRTLQFMPPQQTPEETPESQNDAPDSPTCSLPDTDGAEEQLSMASPGTS